MGGDLFDVIKPFLFGGISGCVATSVIQPIDTVKVQIQVIGESNAKGGAGALSTNPFQVAQRVIQHEGVRGLYKGLDAALLRQITYGTTRLGLFRYLSDHHKAKHKRNLTFGEKALFSSFSGFIGCLVGNPADVSLVRCQRDSLLPPDQRRNYKHVGDALTRMVREEGILSLWRGSIPTICRAISMNMGMLTTYDQIKEMINDYTGTKDTMSTQVTASACAGVVCSTLSLPFDNAKTKLQGMKAGPDGKFPYKNIFDCMGRTVAQEGITGLWIGLPTYIFRVSPHAITALLVQDFLHHTFSKKAH
ncbi:hypothetical protein ABPG74_019055 [Tetrahymena malaccensis]